jgi:hypothetical protein
MWLNRLMVLASSAALAASATAQTPGVCERLATQLQMKPGREAGTWQVNLLGGVKNALLGGKTAFSMQVMPIEGDTSIDQQTLERACSSEKGNLRCTLDRPLRLQVSTAKGDGSVVSTASERAVVETKGTRLTCRTLPAA